MIVFDLVLAAVNLAIWLVGAVAVYRWVMARDVPVLRRCRSPVPFVEADFIEVVRGDR